MWSSPDIRRRAWRDRRVLRRSSVHRQGCALHRGRSRPCARDRGRFWTGTWITTWDMAWTRRLVCTGSLDWHSDMAVSGNGNGFWTMLAGVSRVRRYGVGRIDTERGGAIMIWTANGSGESARMQRMRTWNWIGWSD
jgi:hypothetical protein